jgi:hypothetical protein
MPLAALPKMPDRPPAAGVQCKTFVTVGHIHHTVRDDRRHLQARRIRHVENPTRCDMPDIRLCNLLQGGKTVAPGVAVVGYPVGLGCYFSKCVATGASQQVQLTVVGTNLYVVQAFREHHTVQFSAIHQLCVGGVGFEAAFGAQRAQIRDERRHFLGVDVDRRHAAGRQAAADGVLDSFVGKITDPIHDPRTEFSAIAVRAMTEGAAVLECLSTRRGRFFGCCRQGDQENQAERGQSFHRRFLVISAGCEVEIRYPRERAARTRRTCGSTRRTQDRCEMPRYRSSPDSPRVRIDPRDR